MNNKLWQLKKLSSGDTLNDPQKLPENWGPIFGLHGYIEKLHDLSWLGEEYADTGWFIVGESSDTNYESSPSQLVWDRAKQLLQESDWTMLSDVPITSGDKANWSEYRRALREIKMQPGFPDDITWPRSPD
jgi:hypothetical protein